MPINVRNKLNNQIILILTIIIYQVYVTYNDITAEDFFKVQTDTEYRKKWDNTAIALEVVDVDPCSNDSHIIYWEMLWPVSEYFN